MGEAEAEAEVEELDDGEEGQGQFFTGMPKSYIDQATATMRNLTETNKAMAASMNVLTETVTTLVKGIGFGNGNGREFGGQGKRRGNRRGNGNNNGNKQGGNGGGGGGGGGRKAPGANGGVKKPAGGAGPGRPLECWTCGEPGHKRSECPKRHNANGKKGAQ
ncbi:hypothetical protein WJX75_001646 [Coccomyxa subellipsoidea]|uniref:CCHC-type domain-containing protein n=1 Tax=Coccomyxa subellipsoidea TaxID=248742 RepID=A0ABR2YAI7_9CHLO